MVLPTGRPRTLLATAERRVSEALGEALRNGDADMARKIGEAIKGMPPRLSKEPLRVAALALEDAMRSGHAEVVRACAEAIRPQPLKTQAELLRGQALEDAMRRGHAEVVRAYAEAIRPQPLETQAELLKIRDTVLVDAMRNDHAEMVRAYSEAIRPQPPETQAEMLTAKTYDRAVPAMFQVLRYGRTEGMVAYMEAISPLPADAQVKLMGDRLAGNYLARGMIICMEEGHAGTIREYCERITQNKKLDPNQKVALLRSSITFSSGTYFGLEKALANFSVTRAYMGPIIADRQLDYTSKKTLLSLPREILRTASNAGNMEAVDFYKNAMESLELEELNAGVDVVRQKSDPGSSRNLNDRHERDRVRAR